MNKAVSADDGRFKDGADKYAAFLQTPEGRLRADLAFANLEGFLPQLQDRASLRALDIGGGTGAAAVRLAQLGLHVTLLDSSAEMLAIAENVAREAGIAGRIALKQGDAMALANLFQAESFDVVLCHNVLEFIEDPGGVLRAAARSLKDSSAILSVLVRNQVGEVLKAAIQAGNLAAAEDCLTAEWGYESLYGGSVRLFRSDSLQTMLKDAKLVTAAVRGVRVIADYLPQQVSRSAEYDRIFKLERKLGCRPEFAVIARYIQCISQCAVMMSEDGS
jgi:S-adenosylmethionine-dependent methyltransferase